MNWLTRLIPSIMTSKSKSKVPDGLWTSCPSCESVLYAPDLEKSLFVCSKCDHCLFKMRSSLENWSQKEIRDFFRQWLL